MEPLTPETDDSTAASMSYVLREEEQLADGGVRVFAIGRHRHQRLTAEIGAPDSHIQWDRGGFSPLLGRRSRLRPRVIGAAFIGNVQPLFQRFPLGRVQQWRFCLLYTSRCV